MRVVRGFENHHCIVTQRSLNQSTQAVAQADGNNVCRSIEMQICFATSGSLERLYQTRSLLMPITSNVAEFCELWPYLRKISDRLSVWWQLTKIRHRAFSVCGWFWNVNMHACSASSGRKLPAWYLSLSRRTSNYMARQYISTLLPADIQLIQVQSNMYRPTLWLRWTLSYL